ncbi:serine protease [Chitinophaga sp.]|uniref:trypsin-like serine peptidase n=1 Tax=Chitinophaga sp. TaxID=1869181 RepID=UPI002F95910E
MKRTFISLWYMLMATVCAAQTDSAAAKVEKIMLELKAQSNNFKTNKQSTAEREAEKLMNIKAMQYQYQQLDAIKQQLNTNTKLSVKEIKLIQTAAQQQQLDQVLQQETVHPDPSEASQPQSKALDEDVIETTRRARLKGPTQFDSRIELFQLDVLYEQDRRILFNAASVGLVIRKENLEAVTDSFFRINTGLTLGTKYKLCPGQAFAKQPVAGEGTAFLIQGDQPRMMTAGHVFSESIDHYAIIFGFEMENEVGAYETLIPIQHIYYPEQITFKDDALDIAVFTLNKPTDRRLLPLSAREPVTGEEVYMIGYPCGLPVKVALNAGVKENNHPQYFFTSLDAFQGNSGSPVFSMSTHEIIGVLVSGEVDFTWNGSCNQVTICSIPFCKGEKAIRISAIQKAAE